MRTTLFGLLAMSSLIAGCRTQPLDRPIQDDFGTVSRDMSMRRMDLSVTTGTGCLALLDCLSNCNDQSCQDDCFNEATPAAQDLLVQTLDCIYGFCQNRDGNRPPRCDQNFEDFGDLGFGSCERCINNAFSGLGGFQCQPPNDPDCNPDECQPFVAQCLQDN
jgi:hypothetical protein